MVRRSTAVIILTRSPSFKRLAQYSETKDRNFLSSSSGFFSHFSEQQLSLWNAYRAHSCNSKGSPRRVVMWCAVTAPHKRSVLHESLVYFTEKNLWPASGTIFGNSGRLRQDPPPLNWVFGCFLLFYTMWKKNHKRICWWKPLEKIRTESWPN